MELLQTSQYFVLFSFFPCYLSIIKHVHSDIQGSAIWFSSKSLMLTDSVFLVLLRCKYVWIIAEGNVSIVMRYQQKLKENSLWPRLSSRNLNHISLLLSSAEEVCMFFASKWRILHKPTYMACNFVDHFNWIRRLTAWYHSCLVYTDTLTS